MNTIVYFILFLLAAIGSAFIFSATNNPIMVLKHGFYFLLASAIYWAMQHPRFPKLEKPKTLFLLFVATIVALTAVLVVGEEVNGAKRWIRMGVVSIQISEFAKVTMILFLALVLGNVRRTLHSHSWPELIPIAFFMALCIPLYLEPDFGSIVLMSCVMGGMLIAAGVPFRRLVLYGIVLGVALGVAIGAEGYRSRRLEAFSNPWKYRTEAGYQTTASFKALGAGGWTGVGYREGRYKGARLPESYNDYILAVIGEERGFLGVMGVMTLYLSLVGIFMYWIRTRLEGWQQLYGVGASLVVVGTVAMNMSVVSGILPAKGLALPLISSGGSALLAFVLMIGLLVRYAEEART